MIAVPTPTLFHPQCMVTKRADPERGPYVDLLRDFDMDHQGRMYVSRVAVEDMAATLGLPGKAEAERLAEAERELEDARARIAQLEEELSAQDTVIQAIDTLESAEFRARKRAGRPKKQETEKATA